MRPPQLSCCAHADGSQAGPFTCCTITTHTASIACVCAERTDSCALLTEGRLANHTDNIPHTTVPTNNACKRRRARAHTQEHAHAAVRAGRHKGACKQQQLLRQGREAGSRFWDVTHAACMPACVPQRINKRQATSDNPAVTTTHAMPPCHSGHASHNNPDLMLPEPAASFACASAAGAGTSTPAAAAAQATTSSGCSSSPHPRALHGKGSCVARVAASCRSCSCICQPTALRAAAKPLPQLLSCRRRLMRVRQAPS